MVSNVVISIKEKSVNINLLRLAYQKDFQSGNCWFIAGSGAVTLNPDLLQRVVPSNQSFEENDYSGRIFDVKKRNDLFACVYRRYLPFSILGLWSMV